MFKKKVGVLRQAARLSGFACLLGCALAPARAENVTVSRKITEEDKNGTKSIRKIFDIKIPYGQISYRGLAPESGRDVEELQFGLNFLRPPGTNGGWDGWNFLRVGIKSDRERVQVFKKYPLDNVYVMESERRVMVRFVWLLPENNAQLIVTTVQYATHPDWLFLRIETSGGTASLDTIDFSCYPGNTSGPPERERWMASLNTTARLQAKRISVDPRQDNAFVFYNLMAQMNAGCQLVVDAKPLETVSVAGGSSVRGNLKLKPGQSSVIMALGGYFDKSTEDVVRVFRMEGAAQIQAFLEKIDWSPQLDVNEHKLLIKNLDELMATAPAASAGRFRELTTQYVKSSQAKDTEAVLTCVRELEQLKNELILDALKKWK